MCSLNLPWSSLTPHTSMVGSGVFHPQNRWKQKKWLVKILQSYRSMVGYTYSKYRVHVYCHVCCNGCLQISILYIQILCLETASQCIKNINQHLKFPSISIPSSGWPGIFGKKTPRYISPIVPGKKTPGPSCWIIRRIPWYPMVSTGHEGIPHIVTVLVSIWKLWSNHLEVALFWR